MFAVDRYLGGRRRKPGCRHQVSLRKAALLSGGLPERLVMTLVAQAFSRGVGARSGWQSAQNWTG